MAIERKVVTKYIQDSSLGFKPSLKIH